MVLKQDEELIEMYLSGDAAAFETLFHKYKGPLYGFFLRKCGNRDVAGDLTQDVFTKLVRKAHTFHHQSAFSTWLFTVARNTAMDYARKARHRNHESLDKSITGENDLTLLDKIADQAPSPEAISGKTSIQEAMSLAIDRLPDSQKEVFVLREFHGMPFHEIAQVVDAHIGTVKSRMRYALETLRQDLRSFEEYAREHS